MRQATPLGGTLPTAGPVVRGGRLGRHAPLVPGFGRAPNPTLAAGKSDASFLTGEWAMLWFLAAHLVLGALVFASPAVAKLHFWVTAVVGVRLAMSARRPIDFAILAAYVVGAEVLWRMSQAALFWETGKFAVSALLVIGLVRFSRTRPMHLPFLYFLLLTPGLLLLTQAGLDFSGIRKTISFNLSGPAALAVAACFFRQCTFTRAQLGGILVAAVGPVVSIAILTALSTYGSSDIVFSAASNFATSGGFGPNQVSGALSAGALLCFLILATQSGLSARHRGVLFATLLLCAVQSAMTFSRGGLYMTGIAMLGASVCLLGDRAGRRLVVGSAVAMVLAFGIVAPMLVSYTGGALAERFQDTGTTGRWELAQDDLLIWAEHPVFGAGVGQATASRPMGSAALTHTEWTRMLAEHGVFGLVSMLVLIVLMVGNVLRAPGPLAKGVAAGLVLWGAAFLTSNDMRIVAPSFLIGLASATIQFPSSQPPSMGRRGTHIRPPVRRP